MKIQNSKLILYFILLFCILIFAFFIYSRAEAASLYFSPSSGSYVVDQTFSIAIYVSSDNQSINAIESEINFPADKLEVESLSKNNSILNFWVEQPFFSNNEGKIKFSGVALNPGFIGNAGKVLTLNFKVKSSGIANLKFNSAAVLANDGLGTNVLNNTSGAQFNLIQSIAEQSQLEIQPQKPIGFLKPLPPSITSPTHPDENKWYNQNNVLLKWSIVEDIAAIKFSLTKDLKSLPSTLINYPFNNKEYKNLEDGIWYFALQFKNKNNNWSDVSYFKMQIDTTPPEPFQIDFIDGKVTRNPRPVILFDTTDKTSGIDYYKIKIGDGDFFDIQGDIAKSNPYTLPEQAPGKHTILVQAFDKAGNYAYAKDEFEILAPPSYLEIFSKKISITLSYLIPLIALILILIILLLYGIRYIIILRKKIKKEKEITFKEIHKIFSFLKKETETRINNLKKIKNLRNLTAEEEDIINDLQKDLDRSEKIIKKDFDEIFKEIDKK